jgi:uncharacterized protein (TIGR03437 family)
MTTRLVPIICAIAGLAGAATPVSFQTHYIRLGAQDTSVAIAADGAGNMFIVSQTGASPQTAIRATKTDPQGNVVAVLDFGQGFGPTSAAVDSQGNLLVVSNSQTVARNAFVAKVDNALTHIVASTTIPATAKAVTTDAAGNVYAAGTAGADFPTTPGAYESSATKGASYAFVAEFSPDLSKTIYATLFGSYSADCVFNPYNCGSVFGAATATASTVATAIAIAPSGSIVIAGYSDGIPALLGDHPYDYGFVAKFSADLSSLEGEAAFNPTANLPQTYFNALALDPQGNVVVVGEAEDGGQFPANSLQPNSPDFDSGGCVLKFDAALRNLLWGTFFGGVDAEEPGVQGVAVDAQGNVWITGVSEGSLLPNSTSSSIVPLPFVAELTPDGSSILNLASSQFGGAAVTILHDGRAAILGAGDSFLLTAAGDQPSLLMVANSANNMSSGTVAPAELLSLYGAGIGPESPFGGQIVDGAFTGSLGGFRVLFNGIQAPLLYAGPNQINVVAPAAIADQQTADIEVVGPSGTTIFPTVFVGSVRPQIFSQLLPYFYPPNSPPGMRTYAIANNQDGTLNSTSNPAARGSIITIWATGAGLAGVQLPDGSVAGAGSTANLPIAVLWDDANAVEIIITNQAAEVLYAGQAPGAVQGLTQINLRVPAAPSGGGEPAGSIYLELGAATSARAFVEVSTN